MRDTYIDRELCNFHVKILKTVSISFIYSELVRALSSVGLFSSCSENNNTSLLFYACEVIHLINKSVILRYV